MSSNYYLGTSPEESLGDSPRYLYMMRRNDDGELFLIRSDQTKDKDSIEINSPGDPNDNFEDFEPGIDYFDGIDENHEKEYANIIWTQYRWSDQNSLYYINEQGQLIKRVNQNYPYPTGVSS